MLTEYTGQFKVRTDQRYMNASEKNRVKNIWYKNSSKENIYRNNKSSHQDREAQ